MERTLEAVILEDGENSRVFGKDDPTSKRATASRSFACRSSVRGELKGILYLENNLAAGVFDQRRKTSCQLRHSWPFLSKTPIYMSICGFW